MIKDENNKEQELLVRELGVFELRGLAREVGVVSPTTKKREELISLILQKFKDGMVVDPKRKTKGRPYKKLSSLEDIVSTMTNTIEDNNKPLTYESIMTFAQEMPKFKTIDDDNIYRLEGIVRCNNDYKMFFTENKWVFIKDIEYSDKLIEGDKVVVEAKQIANKNQYLATSILSINGIEANNYLVSNNDNGEEIISNQTIPYGNSLAFIGRRNVYMFDEDVYENDSFANFTNYCKENNIRLLVLSLNTSYETQIMFKNHAFENFTTPYGSNNDINFNKVIDTINYAQNLTNRGENVVVLVLDIIELLRALDKCFVKENLNEHCEQTVIIADKIMSLGKAYKASSTTVLLGYNKLDQNDRYLNNNILRISKKI